EMRAPFSDKATFEVNGGQPVLGHKFDNEVTMNEHPPARCNDHAAVRHAREGDNCALHFGWIARVDQSCLYPERRRQRLGDGKLAGARSQFGIANDHRPGHAGAISLSSSSHLPLMLHSNAMKPVVLPPGRARLSTKPAPTASATPKNTVGTVRLTCRNGPRVVVP